MSFSTHVGETGDPQVTMRQSAGVAVAITGGRGAILSLGARGVHRS